MWLLFAVTRATLTFREAGYWLGHSTYSTTADIYSHLNFNSKLNVAGALSGIFGNEPTTTLPQGKNPLETIQTIFNPDTKKISVDEQAPTEITEFKIIKEEMN